MKRLSFKKRGELQFRVVVLTIIEPVSDRFRPTVRAIRRGMQQQLDLGVEFESEDEEGA